MCEKLDEFKSRLLEIERLAEDLVQKANTLYNEYDSYISDQEEIDNEEIREKIEQLEAALEVVESDTARQLLQEEISKLEVQISDNEDFEDEKEELKDLFSEFADVFSGLEF